MNQKLQTILNFVESCADAERKTELINTIHEINKELEIEAALDRVRIVATSMRQRDDLLNVCEVFDKELKSLGFSELRNTIINILIDERESFYNYDFSNGNKTVTCLPYNVHPLIKKQTDFVKNSKEAFVELHFTGTDLQDWIEFRKRNGKADDERLKNINSLYYYFYSIGIGAIGISTFAPITEEKREVLKRFKNVFDFAYHKYLDIEKANQDIALLKQEKKRTEDALKELKIMQAQLIQSEKMASLGELTAGIAHEIQNPLNFVNNFSEVSSELVDEMLEEIENDNKDEIKNIANNIQQNLQKILHHGQRANSIVKSMLQHSRNSSGVKEPTNINSLADEYLRLAYHGLRAKDKSFNANLVTQFDDSISDINIVQQDVGRVILNLITNAFYAVNEKKAQIGNGYDPTVTVGTKKDKDYIELWVKDNGNGIPSNVLDKIFQPFFTTKPTGEGTGLGLSLSYEIIKAHGGELKVETEENKSTTFKIVLPLDKI